MPGARGRRWFAVPGARKLAAAGVLAVAIAGPATPTASAAEATRVVSAFDDDNRFDFNLTLSFLHEAKSAFIKREQAVTLTNAAGDSVTRNELVKDLQYKQTRNVLGLRADFGVLRDVGFHVEAPIVLTDDRELDFDQSLGGDCPNNFPGQVPIPTCVNGQNSTARLDGIGSYPGMMSSASNYGLDAKHNRQYQAPSQTYFSGPTRSGIEYLGLGLDWAIFNQVRDDTKPTFKVGFDTRLDVSKDMRFDPLNPGGNTAVGLGYHQLIWSTTVSKRFRHFDPYFGAWYMLPVRSNGSPFQKYPVGGQTAVEPQQQAGVQMGFEQIAWERPSVQQRVTVEFRAHMQEHFYGRSHTELWEALSGSPQCATDVTKCRADPSMAGANYGIDFDGNTPSPHPGVTETEAYASFGGNAGVNIQVGRYIRFRGVVGLTIDTPHFITFANAGVDKDGSGAVELTNPNEKNPTYREIIDNPGRRFRVEGTQIWSGMVEGSLMF